MASLQSTLSFAWNLRYLLGIYRDHLPAEAVVSIIAGSQAKSCLELGCGRGALLSGLRRAGWQGEYHGVDLVPVAVRTARERHRQDPYASFQVGRIEEYPITRHWDFIALVESIYYLDHHAVSSLVRRWMSYLSERGSLLIRIHDPEKHWVHVQAIEAAAPNLERLTPQLFRIALER